MLFLRFGNNILEGTVENPYPKSFTTLYLTGHVPVINNGWMYVIYYMDHHMLSLLCNKLCYDAVL